ncbi:MAG TPA: sortase [Candidatus Limnocylindrales bacterium]|nr:sortase [Candidatus Limnocylindrales bacterium]
MSRRQPSSRRLLLPLLLATVLGAEVAGLAFAARGAVADGGPNAPLAVADRGVARPNPDRRPIAARAADPEPVRRGGAASAAAARRVDDRRARPAGNRGAVARPEIAAEAHAVATGAGTRRGRNHVWIPSLGIDRSVEGFSCDRTRPPDNFVYRWGCAGRNNVYLLGHAYSVFKPLHDAYVTGRLRKGMIVDYADASGRVQRYAIAWWKVVRPTGAASWAWAPQAVPSMTLQTCVGARSEYRLMVRLISTD